jgi:solute carrier family 8 (sodium/calcium exchanger)
VNIATKKKKLCGILSGWAHSVSNHVYYVAASSNGDEELAKAKWMSIMNHIVDKHEGHGELYPKCLHEPLQDRDWLNEGTCNTL